MVYFGYRIILHATFNVYLSLKILILNIIMYVYAVPTYIVIDISMYSIPLYRFLYIMSRAEFKHESVTNHGNYCINNSMYCCCLRIHSKYP